MTLKEIATLANVSISTVSKVINNKAEHIPSQTRDKVLAIIEENNYIPYQKSIEKMMLRAATVGLLISDISDVFCAELAKGVEDYFFSKGCNVIICSTYEDAAKEQKYIEMLKNKVQGIIGYPMPNISSEYISTLETHEISSVILDNYSQVPNVLKTYFNNKKGGYIATQHLIDCGHRRIGYISGLLTAPYLSDRYAGFQQALADHSIEPHDGIAYIYDERDFKKNGYNGAKYLMSQGVTAVFCCNDQTAAGAYEAIAEAGREIPKGISVVGFDDSIFCEFLTPKLTSVRQPAYDIGYHGASLLYNKINGIEPMGQDIRLEPRLIQRDSVAPPDERGQKHKKIAVIGEIRMDVFLEISNQSDNNVHVIDSESNQIGGRAAKHALELRRRGAKVYLIGRLGNDSHGHEIYEQLFKSGIKVDGLVFDETLPTGTAYITSFPGAIKEAVLAGANASLNADQLVSLQSVFNKVECCHIDGNLPQELIWCIKNMLGVENIDYIKE